MKDKKNIFLIMLLLIILLLFGCSLFTDKDKSEFEEEKKEGKTYALRGTGPGGGIVFYITDGGLHGLEAAPSDQSAGKAWIIGGSTQTTLNGNTLTAIGKGQTNTAA